MRTGAISRVHRSLRVDADRWVIEWKIRTIQALPVGGKSIDIDLLPVLQLEFNQVNVNGMSIFGEVLDVPRLRRADPRDFSDVFIEMPSVDEHSNRIASHRVLRLIEREKLRIPDIRRLHQSRNGDQCGRQGIWMHGL